MNFQNFLTLKLKERKIDVSVYHSYLLSILEDQGLDEEEKRETVQDIVASLVETDVDSLVNEIFEKWNACHTNPEKPSDAKTSQTGVDIAELLKTQTNISLQNSSHRGRHQLTDEEKRIKEQILASYSQTSDKEDDDDEENGYDDSPEDPNLEKNTNKADVQKLAKDKRDQAKLDSEQKKLKDKEDRAKQKANREDKKAKRQTAAVKGERRR